jgi:MFS family permease
MSQQYDYPVPATKKSMFSSLAIKNFRIYTLGNFISMIGVWMQIVALSWLIWKLTHSGDWLGVVGFAGRFPIFIFVLIGGAVADKFLRRKLLLGTQTLAMIQASLLALLTVLGIITPEIVVGLVILAGLIYSFDFPARQSFITDMVGKDEVDNAVALSASVVHAARVIGPALAGIIVAYWGEGACFVVNAVTFLALIISLLLMKKSELKFQPVHDLPMHKAIFEGLRTAWLNRKLKKPLILLAMLSLFGMPYYILVPIFVDEIYGRGSEFYGFLMATSAVGSLCGSFIMAKNTGKLQLKRNMTFATVGFAISVMTFAWMKTVWMGMSAIFFIGLFALVALASINAWLQKEAPDEVRGRIMSLYTMMFFGVTPIGGLAAGVLAEKIGAPTTLSLGSGICLVLSIWFLLTTNVLKEIKNSSSQAKE